MDGLRAFVAAVTLASVLAGGCGDSPAPEGPAPPAPPTVPEASRSESHRRMVALLEEVRARSADENEYTGDAAVRRLEADWKAMRPDASAAARWHNLALRGEGMVLAGREREGIALMEEAYALLPQAREALGEDTALDFIFRLGTCWMRVGETENCCARDSVESCRLPLRGPALHDRPEGSRRAMERFKEVMDASPDFSPMQLQGRWLYNIAAMTLGLHPSGVEEKYLIPESAFAPDETFPRFPDVAKRVGLDTFSLSGGVIAEDFDGDGDMDLLVSNSDPSKPVRFHRNEGNGTFTDRTSEAGLDGILGGLNMIHGDADGDGFADVLVLRGGWMAKAGRQPRSLLHNNGNGTFTDVTFDVGLADSMQPSQTAAFADIDKDGDLDLFIGNETTKDHRAPCELFLNDGTGRFKDVAAAAGVTNDRWTKGCSFGDYDNDGFPDLYVSNLSSENRLYRNRGDGTFEDVAPALGVVEPLGSFPCWWWDYDNDGNLDLYVAAYPAPLSDMAAAALGRPFTKGLPRLYRGDGRGGFRSVGIECNLVKPTSPMGCNFGDLDNDGYPDFHLGTGNTLPRDLMPNLMYHNQGGRRFADVSLPGGFAHLQKGHGIAFADFDGDGDLDVFAVMGGAYRGDGFRDSLYENPGFGRRWLAVEVKGTKSNRLGIGVRLQVEFMDGAIRRTVHARVGAGGSFGGNPFRQHIGLGRAEVVDRLLVTWPATGVVHDFRHLPVDAVVTVTEDSASPALHRTRPVRLGGGAR